MAESEHNLGGFTPSLARELALKAGFAEAGIVALPYLQEEREAENFRAWIAAGRSGSMQYLARQAGDGRFLRESVSLPFPWARSVLVCFASYNSSAPLSTETQNPRSGWIARYAWSSRKNERGEQVPSDYHKVLLRRLRRVEAGLHERLGEFESRAFVDTGPVVERSLAVAAGLGWTGKNTCLIHPKLGSFGFLAVLLTSLELDAAPKELSVKGTGLRPHIEWATKSGALAPAENILAVPDRCGTCTRCIEACPTGALVAPRQMDATRCIAYLTIEHKGPIAGELMEGMGRQVFGCDICQDVCPWNRKAPPANDAELEPRAELINPALDWLGSLDEQSFEEKFNGSPVRRAGFFGLKRNVAIAMGNNGDAIFTPQLEAWVHTADEGLRTAARWAIGKLRRE